MIQKPLLILFPLLIPSLVHAQAATIGEILEAFLELLRLSVPVVVGLAVLLFLWGVALYVTKTDSPEGREGAKQRMFWGIITIFVMVSIWGIVIILQETIGTDVVVDPEWPQL